MEEYSSENPGNTLMNFLNLDPNTSDKLFNHIKRPPSPEKAVVEDLQNIDDEVNDKFQIGALQQGEALIADLAMYLAENKSGLNEFQRDSTVQMKNKIEMRI